MTIHKTWLNAKETPAKGEVNSSESMTVPDQNMSLAHLLEKHTRGHAVKTMPGLYDDPDDLMPDVSRLDLSEKHDLLIAARKRTKQLQELEKEKNQPPEPAPAASGEKTLPPTES